VKKTKLVVFDMGNTLLNFHSGAHSDDEKDQFGIQYMNNYIMDRFSINIPIDILKTEFLEKWFGDFYLRDQLIELDVIEYLDPVLSKYNLTLKRIEYIELMSEFYKMYREEVVMSRDTEILLSNLHNKGIKLAVVSNCILFDEIYEMVFKNLGIAKYIDKFVFSYSRQIRKPDKRIYKELVDCFGVESNNIIMVGDSLKADIKPSKELGFTTIWINRKNENDCECHADIEVKSFEEAITILMNIEE
jgi:putative hydrolase of the HAD superfamily